MLKDCMRGIIICGRKILLCIMTIISQHSILIIHDRGLVMTGFTEAESAQYMCMYIDIII